jgi:Flp pilus assembly protein TadB
VTPLLALSLMLAIVAATAGAGLYLAWPRGMTAEEWVMHRREATRGRSVLRPGWVSGLLGTQSRWSHLRPALGRVGSDLRLLNLQGLSYFAGEAELVASVARLSAVGAVAGLAGGLALWLLSGHDGPFGVVILMAVALGVLPPAMKWERVRRQAAEARGAIRRRLPRLLTSARVVLEGSGVTPQQALSVAVAVYRDPAADVLREALLDQQVRRIELPDALEQAGNAYSVEPLRRLADAYRVATRQGTKMADLLSEFALDLRQEEHAAYRERMTRAPVLMAPLVMFFFVLPLLAMVFLLVLTPLMRALSHL